MTLKSMIDRISRTMQPTGLGTQPCPELSAEPTADLVRLACEIDALAPDRAVQILGTLKRGLDPDASEFDHYLAAEALSTAVYPKYKFSEYARLLLEDDEFLAYYARIMDPGNWHSLDRKYALRELLKLLAHLGGDVVECGAYKGASAYLMCRALEGSPALVHLFDSFEGLAEPLPIDGPYWRRGALTTSEDLLHDTLSEFANYRVYKGWIPERFPEVADRSFRLVHIDVDLYEPTLASLTFFYPRLLPGGIALLDDYGFKTCPGAKRAADDFFATKPERIAMLPTGQAFVIKR